LARGTLSPKRPPSSPARVFVLAGTADQEGNRPGADLARRLGLPVGDLDQAGEKDLLLVDTDDGLELRAGTAPRGGRARVDWGSRGAGPPPAPGDPLRRAAGRRPGLVVDATAGFGTDAFALARLGHRVLALEKSAVMAALLEDGLRRALADPRLEAAARRIRVRCGDSIELLAALDEVPDAIYIDPMYPPARSRKSALPPMKIQLLRRLVGEDTNAPALLAAGLASGARRVILKRPPGASPLPGPLTASHPGKLVRFDVYHPGPDPGTKDVDP